MERYAAFLRGININGKNKIAMSELKECFEEMGFSNVKTYLNSGNVTLSTDIDDIRASIEKKISESFGFDIPVYVIKSEEIEDILSHSPEWWGTEDKNTYDNLIFILSSDTAEDICSMIGEPSEGLERIQIYKNIIYWTFDRKIYSKCSWWKRTASAGIAERLTIRTANTLKKMC